MSSMLVLMLALARMGCQSASSSESGNTQSGKSSFSAKPRLTFVRPIPNLWALHRGRRARLGAPTAAKPLNL